MKEAIRFLKQAARLDSMNLPNAARIEVHNAARWAEKSGVTIIPDGNHAWRVNGVRLRDISDLSAHVCNTYEEGGAGIKNTVNNQ